MLKFGNAFGLIAASVVIAATPVDSPRPVPNASPVMSSTVPVQKGSLASCPWRHGCQKVCYYIGMKKVCEYR